jgi:hypothetical protein
MLRNSSFLLHEMFIIDWHHGRTWQLILIHDLWNLLAYNSLSVVKQSTGAFIAVSRYASATPLPPSILSRGVGWQV